MCAYASALSGVAMYCSDALLRRLQVCQCHLSMVIDLISDRVSVPVLSTLHFVVVVVSHG